MERWEKWEPIKNIPLTIYNDLLVDNDDGLTMKFSDESSEKKVIVNFEGLVLCYRNRDEGSFLKKLGYLSINYPPGFYGKWPFFKVSNSDYVHWFIEESEQIYSKDDDIHHYVFMTPHDVIEVLSTYAPTVVVE